VRRFLSNYFDLLLDDGVTPLAASEGDVLDFSGRSVVFFSFGATAQQIFTNETSLRCHTLMVVPHEN